MEHVDKNSSKMLYCAMCSVQSHVTIKIADILIQEPQESRSLLNDDGVDQSHHIISMKSMHLHKRTFYEGLDAVDAEVCTILLPFPPSRRLWLQRQHS